MRVQQVVGFFAERLAQELVVPCPHGRILVVQAQRHAAIDEASLGPNHPEVAIRLNNLALLLRATNRLSEAKPLFRRAVGIVESSLGSDHPYTLTFRENLELLLAKQGKAKG
ncbi:MAG TPA: tetratricopeptide repeat protein [Polyangia bacterium]|nr:tetratricopeptide repeat protein [Polyangia bacterium]